MSGQRASERGSYAIESLEYVVRCNLLDNETNKSSNSLRRAKMLKFLWQL